VASLMVRRRRVEAAPPTGGGPDELARCWVEQWTTPEAAMEVTSRTHCGRIPTSTVLDTALVMAWGAHRRALWSWAAENGVSPAERRAVLVAGRPTFNDRSAFADRVRLSRVAGRHTCTGSFLPLPGADGPQPP
jgi:hypothetical protein